MTRHSPEGAVANILWRLYEMSLPDTPYRMGVAIVEQLRREGYIEVNNDPSTVEGRESLSPYLSTNCGRDMP
jgi:hypothetical protein